MKKKLWCLVLLISLVGLSFMVVGCSKDNKSYLRIHIRANSNLKEDQEVKYYVKDKVVEYITPMVSSVSSKKDLENKLNANKSDIENFVNDILKNLGFNYRCEMKINNEYFPTRTYDNLTLKGDYYDALILNLGSGTGDNWWCVVYPPLCFTNQKNSVSVVYKSKLVEIIRKFFK